MGGAAVGSGLGLNGDVAHRWRHGRVRSGPARGDRRRSWYGSKKGISPHALKVQAAVLLHPIEPNRQKIRPYHPMDPPPPSFSDGVRSEATSDCQSVRPPDVDRLDSGLPSVRVQALPALLRAYRTICTRRTRIVHVATRPYARTMAELYPASRTFASGIRRGCRTDARASR